MKSQIRPLVIFALDSANLDLVERWSEADSLPNFASLLKHGKKFTIAGGGVYDEIGSWVSVFSGLSQNDHGYYCGWRLKRPHPLSLTVLLVISQVVNAVGFVLTKIRS